MEVIRHICRSPCQKIKTSPRPAKEKRGRPFCHPMADIQLDREADGRSVGAPDAKFPANYVSPEHISLPPSEFGNQVARAERVS